MNTATAAALNRINRRFYSRYAAAFSATRTRPWSGWRRAVEPCVARWSASAATPPSILDVGCGNGRFGEFLGATLGSGIRYRGIDASAELLGEAGRRLAGLPPKARELLRFDVATVDLAGPLADRHWDLIVIFGVLHHLPGHVLRRRLLEQLAAGLAPAGMLALSFWQFGTRSRFQKRVIPWSEHNRVSDEAIDTSDLEPGDLLLAWGSPDVAVPAEDELGPRRYCHFAGPDEAGSLVASLGLEEVDRFRADGASHDLNLYYLLAAGR